MLIRTLPLVFVSYVAAFGLAADDDWQSMFNGRDLTGWRVNENPESVFVEDGCLVVQGKRAHAFYVGKNGDGEFKNFHFKAKVMTMPKANSGSAESFKRRA